MSRHLPEVYARGQGPSWNVSLRSIRPRAPITSIPAWGLQQIGLTATLVNWSGSRLASAELSYGSPGSSWVRVKDIAGGASYDLGDRLLPPDIYKSSSEGTTPQRYIVSFQHSDGDICTVTVYHTSGVVVGQVQIVIPPSWGNPVQLVLSHIIARPYQAGHGRSSELRRLGT